MSHQHHEMPSTTTPCPLHAAKMMNATVSMIVNSILGKNNAHNHHNHASMMGDDMGNGTDDYMMTVSY
jgi:hypothetical protein